jgi:hypothetical protein
MSIGTVTGMFEFASRKIKLKWCPYVDTVVSIFRVVLATPLAYLSCARCIDAAVRNTYGDGLDNHGRGRRTMGETQSIGSLIYKNLRLKKEEEK